MEIKRFNLLVCIVAFSCAGLAIVLYYLAEVSALITMVYLPIEVVAWVLRWLSLSSTVGDIVAWILYISICIVPIAFIFQKKFNLRGLKRIHKGKNSNFENENFKNKDFHMELTDAILIALSAYLFFMMYCFINSGMLSYILPELNGADMSDILPMLKNILAGVAYSLIIGFVVLKFSSSFKNIEIKNTFIGNMENTDLRNMENTDIEKDNFKNAEIEINDIKSEEIINADIENVDIKITEIKNVSNKNANIKSIDIWKQTERILIVCTLLYVGFVCFVLPLNFFEQFGKAATSDTGTFLSLAKFFLDLLPMACFVGIMEAGVTLIHVLKENKYSERAVNTAKLLAERSRRTVVVSVVCNITQNIVQLIFWHQALNANFLLDIPFLPLILAFAGLLIAEYLKESLLLYDDNSMII